MRSLLSSILIFLSFNTAFAQEATNIHYAQTNMEKIKAGLTSVGSVLFGSSDLRGTSLRTLFSSNFKKWKKLSVAIHKTVDTDRCDNILLCENYFQDYALSTNSPIAMADVVEPLFDGPASFAKRNQLIEEAKESIHFISWALYDDETGEEFKELLLQKLEENPDFEIKIIIDEQVAMRDHHFAILKELIDKSDSRIQIMRWRTKKYRANGNHRKFMVVDKEHVIAGGMNVGNVYSHLAGNDFWRDTDIYISGQASAAAFNLFASIWNEQVKNNKKESNKVLMEQVALPEGGDIPVVINDHNPGTKEYKADQNITTGMVKLIKEAHHSIRIENAYLILTEPIKKALEFAIEKGVKVEILTNSQTSVDEPVVSAPIMESAIELTKMGANVFLRKGATLHSKFMVIDEQITMVGSFNLHPRSYRFEAETMFTVFDKELSEKMVAKFNEDTSLEKAKKLYPNALPEVEKGILSWLAKALFFNHL